jgi:hypothetical protein
MSFTKNSKLARIRQAMAAGDWDRAIRLAARFPILGEQTLAIRRANDALNNSRLYLQLRHDVTKIRQEGIAALKTRFSKSWQSVANPDKTHPRRKEQKRR